MSVSRSNFIVELSPYCFPLITIVICSVRPFFVQVAEIYVVFLAGFSLGQHLCSLLKDFHLGQSDILNNGVVFSFSVVLFFNVLFIGLVSVTLSEGFSGVPLFAVKTMHFAQKCIYIILKFDYALYGSQCLNWCRGIISSIGF